MQIKFIVAAVALAVSGASQALIQGASVTGGSELVFSAWGNGNGYTFDLANAGFDAAFGSAATLDSIIGAGTNHPTTQKDWVITNSVAVVYDFALPSFSDFVTTAGALQWNLAAADSSGKARVLHTVAAGVTPTNLTDSQIIGAANGMSIYVGANNGKGAAVGTTIAQDVAVLTTSADLTAYPGNSPTWGDNIGAKLTYKDAGTLAADSWANGLDLYVAYSKATTSTTTKGFFGQLETANGQAYRSFVYLNAADNEYHLQISAVPEPESYAMLLAGLGMIGLIARRRIGK